MYVGIDPVANPNFPLIGKLLGQKGAFVKHITQETGAKVQLKGRGSGYIEAATQSGTLFFFFDLKTIPFSLIYEFYAEAPEPLYLHISGAGTKAVMDAKALAENLVAHVKQDFAEYLATKNHPVLKYALYPLFHLISYVMHSFPLHVYKMHF